MDWKSIIGKLFPRAAYLLKGADSWFKGKTGMELTGAEVQQNDWNAEQALLARNFNASEAQKQREWEESMDNTKYQRMVADMKTAGVNPALAMSSGVSSPPAGSNASASAPSGSVGSALGSMSEIMQLIMAKKQGKLLDAQADQARALGDAAVQNADTNKQNAESRSREVDIQAMLANNSIKIGDSVVSLNESQMDRIAQDIKESESRISLQDVERMSKELGYEFSKDTYESNKALVVQQLAYRAVEMSQMRALVEKARADTHYLDTENLINDWKRDNPKLAKVVESSGAITGVIGNIIRGSISGVIGKWSK